MAEYVSKMFMFKTDAEKKFEFKFEMLKCKF